ncbi:MAG: 3'(2'),5'-bisphosphate nucleotidase CysQ [Inquilinus sp.]|nr:3'(2'),5'-bisphosphate nucleotidase CysQ [Inquilinus sp.]
MNEIPTMRLADSSAATLLRDLLALCRQADAAILRHYRAGTEGQSKADGSPVTIADTDSEAIILAGLKRLTPDIPIVSEERAAEGERPDISGGRFWLVDPLDGTREFLSRNGEFTVNIGLIEAGRPVLGVISAPALSVAYLGRLGDGAWRVEGDGEPQPIAARPVPPEGPTVVASRSHGDRDALAAYLGGSKVAGERPAGSSLKFCLLATGEADLYPRFGRTMEWDTAAGEAILRAAGGSVESVSGEPLLYGKPSQDNPHFIAFGRR